MYAWIYLGNTSLIWFKHTLVPLIQVQCHNMASIFFKTLWTTNSRQNIKVHSYAKSVFCPIFNKPKNKGFKKLRYSSYRATISAYKISSWDPIKKSVIYMYKPISYNLPFRRLI